MITRAASRALSAFTVAGLLAGAWLVLAPPQLGGSTRYAVVDGASMEPRLHRGDLVLVRANGHPDVGDVVLYRNSDLGVRVLHRVVERDKGRLVLKGDANEFLDEARPAPGDVIGSFWFSIPHAGSVLFWIREPMHAALVVFLLAIVAAGGPRRPRRNEEAIGG